MNPTVQRSLPLIPVVNPLMAGSLFRSEPQLGGRAVTWHDAQSFKAEMGRQYGPSFQNWLSPKQRDQINGADFKPKHGVKIAQTLAASTQRQAGMQFVDRHLSPQGQFRDPALARHYAHVALDEARARAGLPALTKAPSEAVCAFLFTPAVGEKIRSQLLANPELFAGIDANRPVAEALMIAPGLRDEARLQLTREVATVLAEGADRIAHALPYWHAVDRLHLPPDHALALKTKLLDQSDYHQRMAQFEAIFIGEMGEGTGIGEVGLTGWNICNLPANPPEDSVVMNRHYLAGLQDRKTLTEQITQAHIDHIERVVFATPALHNHPHIQAAYHRVADGKVGGTGVLDKRGVGWLVYGVLDVLRDAHRGLFLPLRWVDEDLKKLVREAQAVGVAPTTTHQSQALSLAAQKVINTLDAQRDHLNFYNLLWNRIEECEVLLGPLRRASDVNALSDGYLNTLRQTFYPTLGDENFKALRDQNFKALREANFALLGEATFTSMRKAYQELEGRLGRDTSLWGATHQMAQAVMQDPTLSVVLLLGAVGRAAELADQANVSRNALGGPRNDFARSSASSGGPLPAHLSNA